MGVEYSIKGTEMNTTAIATNQQATMSSLDLLEMVNASREEQGEKVITRLNDFHARVADELDGEYYETFVKPSSAGGGRPTTAYRLTKDQCMLVSMRESKAVRRSVLEKLKAIEVSKALPDFSNPVEAARAWADAKESEQKALASVEAAKPAIEFTSRVQVSHDAITAGEAAKTIGTGRNRLLSFLRHHGWVNRRNEPYQSKIEAGLMDVKVGKWEHPEQGLKENITPLVTGKGLVKLQRLWEEHKGVAA